MNAPFCHREYSNAIYIYIVVLKTYCNLSAMWGCSYIDVYCLFSRIDNYLSHLISHTLLISYITHISYHDISHRTLPSTLTTALLYFLLLRNEKAYRRRILSNNWYVCYVRSMMMSMIDDVMYDWWWYIYDDDDDDMCYDCW